ELQRALVLAAESGNVEASVHIAGPPVPFCADFDVGDLFFADLLEGAEIRAGDGLPAQRAAGSAGGERRLEGRRVDVGAAIAAAARDIQEQIVAGLVVETDRPARFFAAVRDDVYTVGNPVRGQRLAFFGRPESVRRQDAAAGAYLVPTVPP